jgi:trehalose/maltose hydrolase-like predicted phosphorylase
VSAKGRAFPSRAIEPDVVDEWSLRYLHFDPSHEGLREALCTLGNGFFATRGAAPESTADGVHYPGTYVAGLYDRRDTCIEGHTVENESIVNLANWLPLSIRVDRGHWYDLRHLEVLDYSQELDLHAGLLSRDMRVRDRKGRVTRVQQRRFVSMANRHVGALETVVTAENWAGRLTVRSGLDGRVVNSGVARYGAFNDDHLVGTRTRVLDRETIAIAVRTAQSGVRVAETARTRVFSDDVLVQPRRRIVEELAYIAQDISFDVSGPTPVRIEKVATLFTSRDQAVSEPEVEAQNHSRHLDDFDALLLRHARDWDHLWRRFWLQIEDGDRLTRLILRLHIFHLLQTVSRNTLDLDVGVPARGLHGEAYRGHVFWDDLFIFPYLNVHLPELVRSLLMYRYRRLDAARWAAAEAGCSGAMFPWQSGSDGREEAQALHLNPVSGRWLPDASRLQRHINSAVAYNVWRYYQATDDVDFLATYGAEVIFEIARFWASAARLQPGSGRYEILGVMGPDEYHDAYPGASTPGLDNNTYTNVGAAWVLSRALETIDLLPEPRRSELREALGLDDEELSKWDDVSRRMRVVFHEDGIPSQFEGYEDLKELDWERYRERYGDIARLDRLLENEGDTPNAYKASKQADVLMLFYLLSADELSAVFSRLGYDFDTSMIPKTIDYYLERTSHGSTLSRVVHAWVLARSDRERSWRFFMDALHSDLDDSQGGTTAEGIHLGAMAGTVDVLQRCYLGIEAREDVLWLNPLLPSEVRRLDLDIRYQRRWLTLSVSDGELTVEVQDWGRGTVRIGIDGEVAHLSPGEARKIRLDLDPSSTSKGSLGPKALLRHRPA